MSVVDPVVTTESSKAPTRKWWATQVTALTALAIMYVTTGSWDTEETIGLIGIVSQAILAYLFPNDSTPGGVPLRNV